MPDLNLTEHVHRRFNPLAGEWVLVSPHRAARPWQGQQEPAAPDDRPAYDPACYLCPGNARAGGERNPDYAGPYVFDNDFAALRPDVPEARLDVGGLLRAEAERGVCRVVCFSPRHDLTLAEMETADVRRVVDVWADETERLGRRPDVNYVQVFENKGAAMGCSNPHPHGQIWAQETVPDLPAREDARQRAHFEAHSRTLLADVLRLELDRGERIVLENEHVVALVPFWAVWPFEALVLPRRPVQHLHALTDAERDGFAEALRRLAVRYDNLFKTSFPYSSGVHQAPTDGRDHPAWHLHLHVFPPLLRSATVKKFMVGYEMLAMPQRDVSAEAVAERLRALPDVHYKTRSPA